MRHPALLLVVFLFFWLSSISLDRKLTEIESVINDYPDSALVLLQNIELKKIHSRKEKARYFLLMSMAYDKNFIDIKSDTLINPAINYYRRRGSADEKLKALYYRGVVERNLGNGEAAMTWYVKAEKFVDRAKDRVMVGRLYTAMMVTYNKVFDIESSIEMAEKASKCYMEAADTGRYISSSLNMVSAYIQLKDTVAATNMLNTLLDYESKMTGRQKLIFFLKRMEVSVNTSDYSLANLYELLSSEKMSGEHVDWLSVAGRCCDMRVYDSAAIALENYRNYNEHYEALYYYYNACICEYMGQYKEAAESFRIYNRESDNADIKVFRSDTKFIKERYRSELKEIRHHLMSVIMIMAISLSGALCVIIFMYLKKLQKEKQEDEIKMRRLLSEMESEKQKFEQMYAMAIDEQKRLKRARKDTALGKNIRAQVDKRLSVLNKFVVANISGMYSKEAFEELSKLMDDRNYFLESTRMSFVIAHPQFLMYLKQFKLTDWEIACCCMYCIGLNGHEISGYLDRKSYYNDSSLIRKKLGLDRKVNIDSFLRKKLYEFDVENFNI